MTMFMYLVSSDIFLLAECFIHVGIDVAVEVQMTLFNSSMSEEDFFTWLRSRGVSVKDCKTLSGKIH